MLRFAIRRGLDVALPGAPRQEIAESRTSRTAAVVVPDHRMRRPRAVVGAGDRVRAGQRLVEDRAAPWRALHAPASGTVVGVERGERREVRTVVVAVEEVGAEPLPPLPREKLAALPRAEAVRRLVEGGLWTAIRARPFGRTPPPDPPPRSLFVTAIDTDPLAPRPDVVIAAHRQDFEDGLALLSRLTGDPVLLCLASGSDAPHGDPARVRVVEFDGPHPSGLVGTHIDRLDPVADRGVVWHVGYQDVIAAGRLATTGHAWLERVIALAGPSVLRPRLVRAPLGAAVEDLVRGELAEGTCRVISGSVLSGRQTSGWGRHLGRFHLQVCALPEPGAGATGVPTTSRGGRPGPMVPVGDFDRVMPLRIFPGPLLRALAAGDADAAREAGCLALAEEDLALCTFVCPAKIEYGPLLLRVLDEIEASP